MALISLSRERHTIKSGAAYIFLAYDFCLDSARALDAVKMEGFRRVIVEPSREARLAG